MSRRKNGIVVPSSSLRLTPGQVQDPRGLTLFRLAWWRDGVEVSRTTVVSGQPGRQTLRTAQEAIPGRNEPIPEGVYLLGDSDGPVNRSSPAESFGPGLGGIWIGIHPLDGFGPERFIGIHEDAGWPGTAGCIGARDRKAMEKIAGWFAGPDRPRMLVVDYGRGTVPGAPRIVPA